MRIRNSLNYKKQLRYKDMGVSMTVPDDSMSLRTMIQKHTTGQAISAHVQEPEWYESNGIDPRGLDLVDLQEIKNNASQQQKEIKEKEESEAKAAQAAALQAQIDARANELISEREKANEMSEH